MFSHESLEQWKDTPTQHRNSALEQKFDETMHPDGNQDDYGTNDSGPAQMIEDAGANITATEHQRQDDKIRHALSSKTEGSPMASREASTYGSRDGLEKDETETKIVDLCQDATPSQHEVSDQQDPNSTIATSPVAISKATQREPETNDLYGTHRPQRIDIDSLHCSDTIPSNQIEGDSSGVVPGSLLGSTSPPLELSIKEFKRITEGADNFWSGESPGSIIEVLMERSDVLEQNRVSSRQWPLRNREQIDPEESRPSRVRIRAPLLCAILTYIEKKGLKNSDAIDRLRCLDVASKTDTIVYLYPFKLFVRFQDQIRELAGDIKQYQQNRDHKFSDISAQDIPILKSKEAFEQTQKLIELFNTQLHGIFTKFQQMKACQQKTIYFEDLWLLFASQKADDLVYEAGSADPKEHRPPKLWKVISFGGGRALLNGNESTVTDALLSTSNAKVKGIGVENRFFIKGFSLNADAKFEYCTATPEGLTIPHWDGPREVQQLKVFPFNYCRPGQDMAERSLLEYKQRLTEEGRKFCELRQGDVRYYEGLAVHENGKFWEYSSRVIIDTVSAAQDAPNLAANTNEILAVATKNVSLVAVMASVRSSLSVHLGDLREVVEIPKSSTREERKQVDNIHNDVWMDFSLFKHQWHQQKLLTHVHKLSDICNSDDHDTTLALFPRIITGFVLSARKWANLDMQSLERRNFNKHHWERLVLPRGYKSSLLAAVRNHVRTTDNHVQKRGTMLGKGQGVTILLQGNPGTGKTFTAEALAAYTERALYPITSGELGDDAAKIEVNLDKILQRGRRWGCIVLLDEADVFLSKRDVNEDFRRNTVVSVFLRLIEYFPGIIILTSNRNVSMDPAIISRCHLTFAYEPLNKQAVELIWNNNCKPENIKQFVADHGRGPVKILVEDDAKDWWKEPYHRATAPQSTSISQASRERTNPSTWWSGRTIYHAFRNAVSLAIGQQIDKLLRWNMQNLDDDASSTPLSEAEIIGKLPIESPIALQGQHFDEVAKIFANFQEGAQRMKDVAESGASIAPPKEEIPWE